jgi:hypothetical protein
VQPPKEFSDNAGLNTTGFLCVKPAGKANQPQIPGGKCGGIEFQLKIGTRPCLIREFQAGWAAMGQPWGE